MRTWTLLLLAVVPACTDPVAAGPVDAAPPADAGPPDASPIDESAPVFALDRVHEIAIEVAPEHVPSLVPENDLRVPCTFTFDDVTLVGAGVRLKGGFGSVQPLEGKPGFSVKLDEFTTENRLHGLRKLVLNNAVQDPSYLSEHIGYEIFRRAGVPATRTAFAHVTFNGADYGLYVIVEAKDRRFVQGWYPDAEGNLYEGSFAADVTHPEYLDLDTNEAANDRSDAEALAAAVLGATPDDTLQRVEAVIDLDEFMRFWAVEALTYHWDGYVYSPNNYVIYGDPRSRRFQFIPHGADQLFQDGYFPIDVAPQAALGVVLAECGCVKDWYLFTVREILDTAWDVPALTARLDEARALIEDLAFHDPRSPHPPWAVNSAMVHLRDTIALRPDIARAMLPDP